MKVLFIIQEVPYKTNKVYNAIRLANQLKKDKPQTQISLFLFEDAVFTAIPNQDSGARKYNLKTMISDVIETGGEVKLCGSCMQERELKDQPLIPGTVIGTMGQLSQLVLESDKVLTY